MVVITFPIDVAMWRVYTRFRHPNVPAGQELDCIPKWGMLIDPSVEIDRHRMFGLPVRDDRNHGPTALLVPTKVHSGIL